MVQVYDYWVPIVWGQREGVKCKVIQSMVFSYSTQNYDTIEYIVKPGWNKIYYNISKYIILKNNILK